jgi:hypothetical protein
VTIALIALVHPSTNRFGTPEAETTGPKNEGPKTNYRAPAQQRAPMAVPRSDGA